ncbi:MAG TPA: LPS export ABC transporter periplasmic protein LptC [Ramlibacter sp.]
MIVGGFIERPPSGRMLRASWERLSVYLPVILMGIIALGTYWLARNSPVAEAPTVAEKPTHEPDSYMRRFSVKTFDPNGRLKNEVYGVEARHYPDTDTVEIDHPRMRTIGPDGSVTIATAQRAVSNADASEVQLLGDAVVTRDAAPGGAAPASPRLEIRSEYLHIYVNAERITSNKPVQITRGDDRLAGDSMSFDSIHDVLEMGGHVRGTVAPRTGP